MSNIDKNIHDVGVVLGVTEGLLSRENSGSEENDIYKSSLYGIHITKQNDALNEDNPHICIGWAELGDLSNVTTKEELSALYQETYIDCKPKAKVKDVSQIWRFIKEMKIGDYIIFSDGPLFHIGRVTSNYIYNENPKVNEDICYVNVRNVQWLKKNLKRTMLSKNMRNSTGAAMSFWSLNDYKSAVDDIINDRYIPDEDIEEVEEFNNYDNATRLITGENVILYGVPGAGKSYTIKNEYMDDNTIMERVVFHPDYTYSDFVGQILPKTVNGNVSYEFMPGPFTKIVRNAYTNPMKKFILVIEEINRGNAPAIFGDIFQLLDRNYQTKESEYGIQNADVSKIVYGCEEHEVKIPSNMSIICTMNTSDQNVFTLDTAFQRRWNMRLIENVFKKDTEEEKKFANKTILDSDISWESFCEAINKLILEKNQNMTSSEDKRLGTHFVNIEDLEYADENYGILSSEDLEKLKKQKEARLQNRKFPEKVIKYLWDDAFKFYRDEIFKGEYESLEKIIREFTTKTKNDRFNIFKDNIKAAIEEINNKSKQ